MIRPLSDKILVRRVEAKSTTAGGIIIPDRAQEKPSEADVLAVGPGKINPHTGNRDPLQVRVGDRVIFRRHTGIDYEKLLFIIEEDILGVLAQ